MSRTCESCDIKAGISIWSYTINGWVCLECAFQGQPFQGEVMTEKIDLVKKLPEISDVEAPLGWNQVLFLNPEAPHETYYYKDSKDARAMMDRYWNRGRI